MRLRRCAMIVLVLLIAPGATPALAHEGGGAVGGFLSGLAHPILVGITSWRWSLWGCGARSLGAPAIWLLPVVFPLVMALGAVLGILGVPLPGVETGIAASAVVLGLVVAFQARPPLWLPRSWSAGSPSSTGMRMAPSCPMRPIR